MAYLKIIRPVNLLLIILVQCIIKFGLFIPYNAETALSISEFFLLVFSTVCIAAAGNVINDIYDYEIDQINKPNKVLIGKKLSEKTAYNYYFMLTIIGVLAGFLLANILGRPGLAAIFVVVSALLFIYSSQLKSILLVGNMLVSAMVAFSLLIVLVFDIFPAIDGAQTLQQTKVSKIVLHFAIFAFVMNLIRELVKDLEDVNGDKKGGISSLAIVLGRDRAGSVIFFISGLFLTAILIYMYKLLYMHQFLLIYFMLLIVAPLLFFCIKIWSAKTQKEYAFLSLLLKLIMFTGLCSMALFQFI